MSAAIMGSQTPTFAAVPASVSSRGAEAIELAERLGLALDVWQRDLLTGALGLRSDGRWSAPEVAVVMSRQNGKSTLLIARELAGILIFGERFIVHSAHESRTALETLRTMLALLEDSEFEDQIRRVHRTHGAEGIEFADRSRIEFRTRTRGGGRGFSADLAIFDEAQTLEESAHAALLPTLSARPNSQIWLAGTAVDQRKEPHGLVLTRARDRGRKRDPLLGYWEWSAGDMIAVDAATAANPEAWAKTNPTLGRRISLEAVAREHAALDHRSFAAERLGAGDWPDLALAGGRVISAEAWDACADSASQTPPRIALGFDVSPDRTRASIVAAGATREGRIRIEVIENRRGTDWLVDRIVELARKHEPVAVVGDSRGPASALLPDLRYCRPVVTATNTSDYTAACGRLLDLVIARRLSHLGDPLLDAAVAAAVKRPVGDSWAWSRRSSYQDITPLVAASLAVFGWEVAGRPRQYLWTATDAFGPEVASEGATHLEDDPEDDDTEELEVARLADAMRAAGYPEAVIHAICTDEKEVPDGALEQIT